MNYSTALLESIEAAQILAGHYQGHTLDTWHLLTAMANNPYSVACLLYTSPSPRDTR